MSSELARLVARALLAPVLAVAAAILVKGYAGVGDGFAAGAVAALGVILQYLVFGRDEVVERLPVRAAPALAFAGLALALSVAVVPWLLGGAPLEHAPGPEAKAAHFGSLELITPVAFDVGVFALVLGAAVGIVDAVAAGEESRT